MSIRGMRRLSREEVIHDRTQGEAKSNAVRENVRVATSLRTVVAYGLLLVMVVRMGRLDGGMRRNGRGLAEHRSDDLLEPFCAQSKGPSKG
mgnify:CR=1 FL=1